MHTLCVWHGTEQQAFEFVLAIQNNCECKVVSGVLLKRCTAHAAMLDQGFCDGLLFARYLHERLIMEEWCERPRVRQRRLL